MKKRYLINVLEQEISVLSDSGDDHVTSVVRFVKDRVDQIKGASSNVNTLNIAILAALNIADEYLKLMEVNRNLYSQLETRSENLISLIDEVK